MKFPGISIIIPTYNSEKTIIKCLKSIKIQDYPKSKIEILIIDDDSTDKTLNLVKHFSGVRVFRNGKRLCEAGKAIGIKQAKNEFILFLDSDNILTHKNWIKNAIKPLLKYKFAVGSEPVWFKYDKKDSLADRYCSLFGINDPLAFYLKRRDRLMQTESKLFNTQNYEEYDSFFLAEYTGDKIPTLGSIGFLTRKSLLLKTNYFPFFFHIDSMLDLVKEGHTKFILLKEDIHHLHSESLLSFLKKINRNMNLYMKFNEKRRYRWDTSNFQLLLAALIMTTFLMPLIDSIKGYIKIRDKAWFLHPFLSFLTATIYSFGVIKWKILNLKKVIL